MNNNKSEIWKDIPGYNGRYQVSNLGNIKSMWQYSRSSKKIFRERMIKSYVDKGGYLRVSLRDDNRSDKKFLIHRLVAYAFINIPDDTKLQINHINGIKTDNNVSNLEWVTCSQNVQHAFDNGLNKSRPGENNSSAILCEKDVVLILRINSYGKLTHREIGKIFGVSKGAITLICSGRNWSYLFETK